MQKSKMTVPCCSLSPMNEKGNCFFHFVRATFSKESSFRWHRWQYWKQNLWNKTTFHFTLYFQKIHKIWHTNFTWNKCFHSAVMKCYNLFNYYWKNQEQVPEKYILLLLFCATALPGLRSKAYCTYSWKPWLVPGKVTEPSYPEDQ